MKAVVHDKYGGPEGLRMANIPVPEPRKEEVRVRVLACAVNLSDWEYLVGDPFYARIVGGLYRPKQPVLGSDIVGIVDKLGPGVTDFAVGDRIMGDVVETRGGFAEFACVPAKLMARAPTGLSDEVAAGLPQAGGIALAGMEDVYDGTTMLINGAGGGSGTMALQLAVAAKAHVTAVDNAGKTDWLKCLGADEVIDYRQMDFTETGAQWECILDMVATRGPGAISRALVPGGRYRAVGGRVRVLLGLLGGLAYRGKSIGMLIVPSGRALVEKVAQAALEGRIAPIIEDVLPLEKVPEAIARTGRGEVKGKIVIRM
ncbi:MAG: zinc-binding dehydrogenase [Alphaproteobacteria bacterium]|nr:zinc-binding dehydrogenase [Alphaproteobacteria bacterium]